MNRVTVGCVCRLVRSITVVVWILAVFAILEIILCFAVIPTETLWAVRTVARELLPLFLTINLLGAVLDFFARQRLLLVFALGLIVSGWPLVQSGSVGRQLESQWTQQGFGATPLNFPSAAQIVAGTRPLNVPPIEVQVLTPLIHLYAPPPPEVTTRLPIVIDIHGGSWQVGGVENDATLARIIAAQQVAVFAIDYRKAPAHRFPAQLDDVRAAITWIHDNAAKYGADPSRIALVGRSAGGHLAMLAGYTSRTVPIRSIVNIYGPADLKALYEDPPSPDPVDVRAKLEALLGGSPQSRSDEYRAASPVNFVRRDVPPTLHLQGGADNVVPARLTRLAHQRLLQEGARSLLVELPWSDHAFDFVYFGPGSLIEQAVIRRFLDATLRP